MKKSVVVMLIISFALIITGIIMLEMENRKEEKALYNDAYQSLQALYQNTTLKIPKDSITLNEVTPVEKKIDLVTYVDEKEEMTKEIENIKKYIPYRDKVYTCFNNQVVLSSITREILNSLENEGKALPSNYYNYLKPRLDEIGNQLQKIEDLKMSVLSLFMDDSYSTVRQDITRDDYNNAITKLDTVVQEDIKNELKTYLDRVNSELNAREEAERIRQAIERERQIEEAWTILDVPYISQNRNNVLNGCEVACLLMALKYKGYLQDMDLVTYATNVPKSSDPNLGFTHDIFGIDPVDVPHWIAPSPLAVYGRNSSGNPNVEDSTGASLADLDNQVQQGNPVIIYLTSKFKTPKKEIEGIAKNVHVLLLVGYNSITGDHIIMDPWTGDDGTIKYQVEKSKVEQLYNALGKRSVVVK